MIPFIAYLKEKAAAEKADTLTVTAIGSFMSTLQAHGFAEVTKDALRMWVVDMALSELKVATRKKYFSRIYTSYRQWKSGPGENPFEEVKEIMDIDFQCNSSEANYNLGFVDRLLYLRQTESEKMEFINLFLYLLYNPMATMSHVTEMQFDDNAIECPQIDELIDDQKARSHRKANVFGLGQGKKREPQILRETMAELKEVATWVGMRFAATFSRESIQAIWIAAALKAGATVAEIRSVLPTVPAEYSSLCLVPRLPISDSQKREIIRRVADSINNKPQQWFVMKMRAGQNAETVKNRIKATAGDLYGNMLFYNPTHKVVLHNQKGKMVKRDVPYIPGVLFFKLNRNLVPLLMSRIGDVAWCFKYSNTAKSQYCTISRNEMRNFQRCIGEFTPDVAMELEVRDTPFKEGTIVKINGGGRLIGKEAVVRSIRNVNGTRTYTLSLTNYLQARWTVKDLEEIYLDPITNDQEISQHVRS